MLRKPDNVGRNEAAVSQSNRRFKRCIVDILKHGSAGCVEAQPRLLQTQILLYKVLDAFEVHIILY